MLDLHEIDPKCDGCIHMTLLGYDGRLDALKGKPVCEIFLYPPLQWKDKECPKFKLKG